MERIKDIPKNCFWWLVKAVVAGLIALGKIMEHFSEK